MQIQVPTTNASIITGGGKGIGKAIAETLSQSSNLVIVGRDQKSLQDVCRDLSARGASVDFVAGDVKDPSTALKAVDIVNSRGWHLRNLICNAGIGNGGNTDTFDPQVWKETFDVNVHGTFYFIQAALPLMLAQSHGKICIVSSVAGVKGFKRQTAYCATKHALVGMARALALEYGKRGIITIPVCPAFVMTDMTERVIAGLVKHQGLSRQDAEAKIKATSPLNRIITPYEVADVVSMICDGKLDHTNGNPLVMSGGE